MKPSSASSQPPAASQPASSIVHRPSSPPVIAVILAAGKGKRMQSDLAKVLHPACGRPMVEYVLDAARQAGATRLVVVLGHQAERVQEALAGHADVEFALQTEQLGTGHAVMMCRAQLAGHDGAVLVLAGDTPLLSSSSLRKLLDEQQQTGAACVVGTAETEHNEGLGRIVRDPRGNFLRIVEQKDATLEERSIREINTGCFAFHGPDLLWALDHVMTNNQQGEYYLTDCAEILRNAGKRVAAACCMNITEAMGVNTPEQLAEVERRMRRPV
jgi:bifunctional UDP-N-acetylglucosamine pyrophosphorylase/glucosamine-1-phosphate N-acetyltransferase